MDNMNMAYQYQNYNYAQQGQIISYPVQQQGQAASYQTQPQELKKKPKSGYSYPEQLWSTKTAKQAFCIDDHLCYPEADEYEAQGGKLQPLALHGAFSKFQLSILNYEQSKSAKINLDPRKLKALETKTMAAEMIKLERQAKGTSGTAQSPAYTVTILGGHANIKGKTPAQAIMEDAANIQHLQAQAQYLSANVGKFRANQSQIDAIADAFNLYNAGKLQAAELPLILYKDSKVPNKVSDAEGYVNYVSCDITCNFSMDYPIKIDILNTKARLDQKGNPNLKDSKEKVEYSFQMTLEEWEDAVGTMMRLKDTFEQNGQLDRHNLARHSAGVNAGRIR